MTEAPGPLEEGRAFWFGGRWGEQRISGGPGPLRRPGTAGALTLPLRGCPSPKTAWERDLGRFAPAGSGWRMAEARFGRSSARSPVTPIRQLIVHLDKTNV